MLFVNRTACLIISNVAEAISAIDAGQKIVLARPHGKSPWSIDVVSPGMFAEGVVQPSLGVEVRLSFAPVANEAGRAVVVDGSLGECKVLLYSRDSELY